MDRQGPEVAVIVPVFRQPGFLAEAVHSALAQHGDVALRVVVVNDGCPDPETDIVARSLALADPRVTYLVRPNGGLSAARNHGIDFALHTWPTLRALFFLDSDNRLGPDTLSSSLALLAPEAGIGWVYPNIDTFGINSTTHLSVPYSRLVHVCYENFCEAGSLVAREIFEQGVRFDPGLLHGLEDWDFWLQCLDLGFRGVNNPASGFQYRRRPASMMTGTQRRYAEIRAAIRARHPQLYRFRTLMQAEHEEAPRFAVLKSAKSGAQLFSDPGLQPHVVSAKALDDLARTAIAEPDGYVFPQILLVFPPAIMAALMEAGILRGLLHNLIRLSGECSSICIRIEHTQQALFFRAVPAQSVETAHVHGLAVASRALQNDDAMRSLVLIVGLPAATAKLAPPQIDPAAALDTLRHRFCISDESVQRWAWRSAHLPASALRHTLIADTLNIEAPLPLVPDGSRFQLGLHVTGGQATALPALKMIAGLVDNRLVDLHLFVSGPPMLTKDILSIADFASINFLSRELGPESALLDAGASLRSSSSPGRLLAGWVAGMDFVLNLDTAAVDDLAPELAPLGIGYGILLSRAQAPSIASRVAFEHVIRVIFVLKEDDTSLCLALGVPEAKIVCLGAIENCSQFLAVLRPV